MEKFSNFRFKRINEQETNLNLTPKEAKVLNENIHNVMKLVLAPYFRK